MKVISLVSGGLDSILATDTLLREGHEVLMLFAAYNQNPEVNERDATQYFYYLFKKKYGEQVHFLEQKVSLGGSKTVECTWGRTLMFIGCALTYDYSQVDMYYDAISFGGHRGDVGLDCTPDNKSVFEQAVEASTNGVVKLLYPVGNLSQEDIGKAYADRHLPLGRTRNCYWQIPCGYRSPRGLDSYRCPGCRRKALAMKVAGYPESQYQMPNSTVTTFHHSLSKEAPF